MSDKLTIKELGDSMYYKIQKYIDNEGILQDHIAEYLGPGFDWLDSSDENMSKAYRAGDMIEEEVAMVMLGVREWESNHLDPLSLETLYYGLKDLKSHVGSIKPTEFTSEVKDEFETRLKELWLEVRRMEVV